LRRKKDCIISRHSGSSIAPRISVR